GESAIHRARSACRREPGPSAETASNKPMPAARLCLAARSRSRCRRRGYASPLAQEADAGDEAMPRRSLKKPMPAARPCLAAHSPQSETSSNGCLPMRAAKPRAPERKAKRARRLQRNVSVLAARPRLALGQARLERPDQHGPGAARLDHVVDITALR